MVFRKTFILFIVSVWSVAFLQAQSDTYRVPKPDWKPFYQKKGCWTMNISNHMFMHYPSNSMPLNLHPEVVVMNNLSIEPQFTWFQFRMRKQVQVNRNVWEHTHILYHHLTAGFRLKYHVNHWIQCMMKRTLDPRLLNVYVWGMTGYNWVHSGHPDADPGVIASNERFRMGAGIGLRSMILPRFGFFAEGGYSSYSYSSFGISVLLHPSVSKKSLP